LPTERVLFVGNSLTYRNDLPAHFAQLATLALGRPVQAEMLAQGGYRLEQHLADGGVQRELAGGRYTALVLQEWGRGLLCDEGFKRFGFTCVESHAAHRELVAAASRAGARSVLLGSYSSASIGDALELAKAEAALARTLDMLHVGLGDLPRLRSAHPELLWLDPEDGQHPGADLTVLMALRTVGVLYRTMPPAETTVIRYNDYRGPGSPRAGRLTSVQRLSADRSERRLSSAELELGMRLACPVRCAGADSNQQWPARTSAQR
jgi:hypothetical protein